MKVFPSIGKSDDLQLSVYDYWHMIRKRKRLAITFFLIVVCSTAIYSLIHPKIYKATTKILIERGNQNIVSFGNIFPVETGGLDYYPTQYKVLKSRTIGRKVLDELDLWSKFSWTRDPVEAFLRQVDVDPVKQSRLVDVSAFSTNPKQAADIANAVVKFYIEQSLNNKLQMTQQASEWLKGKSNAVREKLTESELELEAVKSEKELVDLSERYLPKHPRVIRTQERVKAIEKQLGREVVAKIPRGELPVYYTQLEREVESNRKIYETMLSRLKETLASEGIVDTNVVIIDRAEVPTKPVAPRVMLNLFLGVLVGAFGGIGLCLVFESLDNTVKSGDDVEKLAQLPLLGIVLKWDSGQRELMAHEDKQGAVAEGFRTIRTSLLFSSPDRPVRTLLIT
ncbi:MAG: GumC family protein, partial [Candidatus Omnitrophica bacterium]|nr:GumC family protein [Candidatus Omnitrophota bacterium]